MTLNQTEAEKLLTIIQRSYPNHFKDFDAETIEFQAKMWQRSLVETNWQDITTTFEIWLNTEKFPPTLAEFKELLAKKKNPELFISAETAWETVERAVRKFGWVHESKALELFSEPIKRAINNIGGWQKICGTTTDKWDFLRKDFISVYNDFSQNQKEEKLLPPISLKRLQDMAEQKRLESE